MQDELSEEEATRLIRKAAAAGRITAKDMEYGQWYRLVPNTIGRFVAYRKCLPPSNWAWLIAINGDTDMQSTSFLAPETEVEPAESKYEWTE